MSAVKDQSLPMTGHPKHWNGSETTINVRDGTKMLDAHAKANPTSAIAKKWNEMKAAVIPKNNFSARAKETADHQAMLATLTTKSHSFGRILKADPARLFAMPYILPNESADDFEARLKTLGFTLDDVVERFDHMYPITPTYYTRTLLSSTGNDIFDEDDPDY